MTRWEYLIIYLDGSTEKNQKRLNGLGEQGWEVVSVSDQTCYLKRPIA